MNWCFGRVNGKLSEVFFENRKGKSVPYAHCFVEEKDYKTKEEKKWIKKDPKRVNLIFNNNKYTNLAQ